MGRRKERKIGKKSGNEVSPKEAVPTRATTVERTGSKTKWVVAGLAATLGGGIAAHEFLRQPDTHEHAATAPLQREVKSKPSVEAKEQKHSPINEYFLQTTETLRPNNKHIDIRVGGANEKMNIKTVPIEVTRDAIDFAKRDLAHMLQDPAAPPEFKNASTYDVEIIFEKRHFEIKPVDKKFPSEKVRAESARALQNFDRYVESIHLPKVNVKLDFVPTAHDFEVMSPLVGDDQENDIDILVVEDVKTHHGYRVAVRAGGVTANKGELSIVSEEHRKGGDAGNAYGYKYDKGENLIGVTAERYPVVINISSLKEMYPAKDIATLLPEVVVAETVHARLAAIDLKRVQDAVPRVKGTRSSHVGLSNEIAANTANQEVAVHAAVELWYEKFNSEHPGEDSHHRGVQEFKSSAKKLGLNGAEVLRLYTKEPEKFKSILEK